MNQQILRLAGRTGFVLARTWLAGGVVLGAVSMAAAGAFDKEGVTGQGTRAEGMGTAFSAIADDESATYYNPAGLLQLRRPEITGMFGSLLDAKESDGFVSFSRKLGRSGAVGVSWSRLHVSGTPGRQDDDTVWLTAALPLQPDQNFAFGANLKWLHTSLNFASGNGNGWGIDVGMLYKVPLAAYGKEFRAAVFAQDLSTKIKWGTGDENQVPQLLRGGLAYNFSQSLVADIEWDFLRDENLARDMRQRFMAGIEGWFFKDHVGVRMGYKSFATIVPGSFTAGISYRGSNFEADYAYIPHNENLGDSHRVQITYRFGNIPPYTIVPMPPVNVVAIEGVNVINLKWAANEEPNLRGYNIYTADKSHGDYRKIATTTENYFAVKNARWDRDYFFVVTAVGEDVQPVESDYSEEVVGRGQRMQVPPPQVFNESEAGQIVLKLPPIDPNVLGYNIYMAKAKDASYDKLNREPVARERYVIPNLKVGGQYFIRMTLVSASEPPVESEPTAPIPYVALPVK